MSPTFSEPDRDLFLGCLVVSGDMQSPLPLEHTGVTVQIQGPLASVLVSQRFGNPLGETAELEYLFPLPHEAAMSDFVLRIGTRSVRADLRELEQARQAYEGARAEGRRSGLLEQRRPNLFALRLANVLPGETILAEIRYQERLRFQEDGYEFVFPMGITPKYDRREHPEEGSGVQVPLARPGETVGTLELSVAVDAGLACSPPTSPSHPLEVQCVDERRFSLRLAGDHIPDRDFVLRYAPLGLVSATAAWTSPALKPGGVMAGSGYFMATVLPPRSESEPLQMPREFIFVLDRSGSMGGEPILQARNALRACLRSLAPGDSFRVLLFDDSLEWYQPDAVSVSQKAVEAADAYLARVDARGGTEIIAALEAALVLAPDTLRTRFVVFLTDGAVSAEARVLETLKARLGTARIFTFGIGPSVNRALLARMAAMGRGEAEFLQAGEDIEGAILRFQDRVSFPVLTDLQLSWQGGSAWDIYPARLPDLYIGRPLEICGCLRTEGQGPAVLVVSGRRGLHAVEMRLSVPVSAQPDPALARVWARARIESLLEDAQLDPLQGELVRSSVIGLALEHRLATPYTAFVAIDQEVASAGKAPILIRVAQPLPAGLNFDAFLPPPPPSSPVMAASLSAPMAAPSPAFMRSSMSDMSIQDSIASLPSFLVRSKRRKISEAAGSGSAQGYQLPFKPVREQALRWLARNQRLDGSWDGEVERTAAALLAFTRAGHTTRAGSFRQAVRRAVEWLAGNPGVDFATQARAQALQELANLTQEPRHLQLASQAAQQAGAGLPAPDDLRRLGMEGTQPAAAQSMPTNEADLYWYILSLSI